MNSWIERIRQHALTHYNEDGWDILVECWTDEDIEAHFRKWKTYEEAVVAISMVLSIIDEVRRGIIYETF